MATTTNYSWETPDDTDLVKDGAAAIRTLGSSIDTTTKALNPSTTLGDIEYRSATANTNTRLGIGSSGQVLTVAAGVPSWATPASGAAAFVGCIVRDTTQQTIATATQTKITFNTDVIDTNGFHDTTTNTERFTVPTGFAGKYRISYNTRFGDSSATGERFWEVYINGANVTGQGMAASAGATFFGYGVPVCVDLTRNLSVGDYVELQVYQNAGANQTFYRSINGAFTFQFLGA
jgi:hypothetical protein